MLELQDFVTAKLTIISFKLEGSKACHLWCDCVKNETTTQNKKWSHREIVAKISDSFKIPKNPS